MYKYFKIVVLVYVPLVSVTMLDIVSRGGFTARITPRARLPLGLEWANNALFRRVIMELLAAYYVNPQMWRCGPQSQGRIEREP